MANIKGTNNKDILNGTAGADKIYGYGGDDIIYGKGGNDEIYGGMGNDELYGGAGDDIIGGGDGNDVIYGGIGNDTLYGAAGDDIIRGGDGNDVIYAGSGSDTIYGDAGDDKIYAGEGADIIYGGEGIDTVSYENYVVADGEPEQGVTVYLDNSFDTSYHYDIAAGDKYYDVENVIGTQYDDKIYGDSGDNIIWGNGGNDMLYGYTYNPFPKDYAHLYAGNDIFYTGSRAGDYTSVSLGLGNNIVYGGDGNDNIDLRILYIPSTPIFFEGFAGNNKLYLGEGNNNASLDVGGDIEITAGDGENNFWLYGKQLHLSNDNYYSTSSASIALGNGNNQLGIYSIRGDVDITTGSGDDRMQIDAYSFTTGGIYNIDAGEGNNDVSIGDLYGGIIDITSGSGDDHIQLNWYKHWESSIADTDYLTSATAIVNAGDGDNNIDINDHGHNAFNITAGNGKDYVSIHGPYDEPFLVAEEDRVERIIDTGAGDDTVSTYMAPYLDIYTGSGNDYLIASASYSHFDTGSGNDRIDVYGPPASFSNINAGSGNDEIFVHGIVSNFNINAGSGNDKIAIYDSKDSYIKGGDGDDIYEISSNKTITGNIIDNYDTDSGYDILKLAKLGASYGDSYSAIFDDNDLVINYHFTGYIYDETGMGIETEMINTLTVQNYALGSDYQLDEIHIGESVYSSDQFLAEMGLTL